LGTPREQWPANSTRRTPPPRSPAPCVAPAPLRRDPRRRTPHTKILIRKIVRAKIQLIHAQKRATDSLGVKAMDAWHVAIRDVSEGRRWRSRTGRCAVGGIPPRGEGRTPGSSDGGGAQGGCRGPPRSAAGPPARGQFPWKAPGPPPVVNGGRRRHGNPLAITQISPPPKQNDYEWFIKNGRHFSVFRQCRCLASVSQKQNLEHNGFLKLGSRRKGGEDSHRCVDRNSRIVKELIAILQPNQATVFRALVHSVWWHPPPGGGAQS